MIKEREKEIEKILKKVYFFLKFRPRSQKEIKHYLIKKKQASLSLIEKVIKILKKQKLIDDKKFIEWFVNQRKIFKPKSYFIIKKELLRLGIDKNLIDDYFQNYPLEEEILAFQVLEKKWSYFRNLSKDKKYQKSISFLIRRGFSFEIAKKVFNRQNKS